MYNKSYYQLVKEGVLINVDDIDEFVDYYSNNSFLSSTLSLQQYLGLSPSLFNLYLQDKQLFFLYTFIF